MEKLTLSTENFSWSLPPHGEIWILLAIFREFAGSGAIFGNTIMTAGFQSKAFQETAFAFLTAGLTLALTNGIFKKECRSKLSLFILCSGCAPLPPLCPEDFWRGGGAYLDDPGTYCDVFVRKDHPALFQDQQILPRPSGRYAGGRIYLYDLEYLLIK